MSKQQKYYVVWQGAKPGIYATWDEVKAQIQGFPNAKYKSFENLTQAEIAFKESFVKHYNFNQNKKTTGSGIVPKSKIIQDSLSVDAACSGNPGLMEYQGVNTRTGERIFHQGPFEEGTNNIGEFLALVHALALLKREGKDKTPIYTDSKTAINWIKNKKIKTTLEKTPRNEKLFELIERALMWLDKNTFKNPIIKWETESWGEIPADFGRK